MGTLCLVVLMLVVDETDEPDEEELLEPLDLRELDRPMMHV